MIRRPISAAERRTRRKLRMLFALFALGVVTQRFALPLGGKTQLPVAFLIYWAAVFWIGLQGLGSAKKTMSVAVGLALGAALTSTMLSVGVPQLSSLGYLMALYAPLAFGPSPAIGPQHMRKAGRFYVSMMLGFSLLAILQFGTQRFLHIPYVDPLGKLPESVVMQGYLTSYPVVYGSDLFKSNAYLFLEASFLSQFLGLAIIIELSLFRRIVPLALLLGGLATTFSGTGAMLVGLVFPFLFVRYWTNPRVILLGLAAGMALAGAIVARPELLARVSEFNGRDTSATARFVVPYAMMARDSFGDPASFFFGHGAGAADRLVTSSDALVNFSAVPKAIIEYGLLGGLPLLLVIGLRVAVSGQPATIAMALIITHYFLSGALLQPLSVLLLFFFIATGYRPARALRPAHAMPDALAGGQA